MTPYGSTYEDLTPDGETEKRGIMPDSEITSLRKPSLDSNYTHLDSNESFNSMRHLKEVIATISRGADKENIGALDELSRFVLSATRNAEVSDILSNGTLYGSHAIFSEDGNQATSIVYFAFPTEINDSAVVWNCLRLVIDEKENKELEYYKNLQPFFDRFPSSDGLSKHSGNYLEYFSRLELGQRPEVNFNTRGVVSDFRNAAPVIKENAKNRNFEMEVITAEDLYSEFSAYPPLE